MLKNRHGPSLGDWQATPEFRAPQQGMRVLLAEPDDRLREVLAEALRIDGHTVSAVADSDSFQQHLASNDAVELIIADHRLPGTTWCEVLSRLACRHNRPEVLWMTSFDTRAKAASDVRLSGRSIAKPFGLPELRAAIVNAAAMLQSGL